MNEPNERTKYIEKVQNDLFKASMSHRFLNSEEGKFFIDYITEFVSSLTNKLINTRQSQEDYIDLRAKIDILRKLKAVLEAQADEKTIAKLKEDLEIAKTDI